MVWTSIDTVTGLTSRSGAQFNAQLRDNLDWLKKLPSAKVNVDYASATASSEHRLDISGGTETWDTDTINGGTNDWFDLNDTVSDSIWYTGMFARWHKTTQKATTAQDGDRSAKIKAETAGASVKEVTHHRWACSGGDSTRTVDGDHRDQRIMLGTCYDAETTNNEDHAGYINHTQSGSSNMQDKGSLWTIFQGLRSSQSGGVSANHSLTNANTVATWWNNGVRDNLNRLRQRPSARIRHSSGGMTVNNNTWTKLNFDTEVYDNAAMADVGTTAGRITIPTGLGGFYYVHGCAVFDQLNVDNATAYIAVNQNGSTQPTLTPWLWSTGNGRVVTGADLAVTVEGIIYIAAGDYIELEAWHNSGSAETVESGHLSHLGATLLSGDLNWNEREFFVDGLPDLSVVDFTASGADTLYIPRSTSNFLSRDVFAHLWQPPVLSVILEDDEDVSISPKGYQKVGMNRLTYDGQTVSGTWDDRLDSYYGGGGFTIPHDGIYQIAAGYWMQDETDGDIGDRGIRITIDGAATGATRTSSAGTGGADWRMTICGLYDCRAGQKVELEALQTTEDEAMIDHAYMTAVWRRDRP